MNIETPEIAEAQADATTSEAWWSDTKEKLDIAEQAAAAARADHAAHVDRLNAGERALAAGGKPAHAAWVKLRAEAEAAEALVRSCDAATAEARSNHQTAERSMHAAWSAHAALVKVAQAEACERLLVEREDLLKKAAEKLNEAEVYFREHLFVARERPHFAPLIPSDSLAAFDASGRARSFRPPPPERFVPCSDERRAQYRAEHGLDAGWGVFTEDEIVALAGVVLNGGGRSTADVLGIVRFNTSPAGWLTLARVPRPLWPRYTDDAGTVEPRGEDIEEIRRSLRGLPTTDEVRKLLGLQPARRTAEG